MQKRSKKRLILNFFITFLSFFLFSGLTSTISFLLFLNSHKLPFDYVGNFIPRTFINLIAVSAVFGIVGTIWKKISVEKPVDEINKVLLKIKRGDLSPRLNRRYYPTRYATIVNNINLMAEELNSIDTLKVSLMSNISHELKTPLSVISNYAALLQNTELPPEKQLEYANAITESSKKMTDLVTNILKLNQLENQSIPSEQKKFDISEQLCESLLLFEDIWETKNIEVETDIDDNIIVNSDYQLLSIVWNNLFSNAFKFTPDNGRVSISLKQTGRYAVIKIRDSGCGIPEDQHELIFEKFYQCDASRGTDGNGLGLALVKRIINITNSLISVSGEPGKGTEFTVKIKKN